VSVARHHLRWNGWGWLGHSFVISRSREAAVLAELSRRLGRDVRALRHPVALDEIPLPPSRLSDGVLGKLRAACGDDGVRISRFERVAHATGKSLPDLLRLRQGELRAVPDAVVLPPDEGAVAAVLRMAADAGLAVVPFGGGSSVVGGVEPRPDDRHQGSLSLDTTRLDALLSFDPASLTATFQAGIDGPALEAALSQRGFTLGHFPQSFEHSTLGGWIATRSSGQYSSRYGGIENLVTALRVVTPEGVLRTLDVPRSAAGPDLGALVLGSEGTLGVIVEATVRVRPAPVHQDARGALLRSFADGVGALRAIAQSRIPVAMARLSDPDETELFRVLRRDPARRVDPTELALRASAALGYGPGCCAVIYVAEGESRRGVAAAMAGARAALRRHGALPLGRAPGRSWRRDRFRTPYLRDWLLDHDVAVDTLETALPWSRLEAAHASILRALRATLERHAGGGLAMAHVSHSYADGASLYFTVVYPLDAANGPKQWELVKADATRAVLAAGGTLSHHHGIGLDHAPWLEAEKGALGLEALAAVKRSVDPGGIMNPGKWA
jgi:alkyldihydroxyacetonephosphate synthase